MKNNKLFAMALSVALTSASAVNMYSSAAMISDKDSDNYKNKIENLNANWTSAEDLTATLSDVLKCGNNALISNVKNAWYKGNDSEFAVYMIEQAVDDSYNFTVELADNDAEQFIKTFKEKVGFTDKMEYFTEVYNNRLLVSCVFSTDNHEFNYMISEKAYSVLNEMTSVIDFSAGFDRSSFEELNMNCYVSIYENMKKSEYDSVYDLVDHEMLMEKYGATYDKATRKIEFPSEISEKEKLECYKYFTVNFDGVISSEYALKGIQISSFDFKDIDISYLENDANCDGETNMADAVIIMQSLANPNKYGINGTHETHITAQGEFNGDMDGNGLTNADALEIQKQLLKISVTDTGEQALFPVVKIHAANEMSQYEEMKKNKPVVIRNEYNPLLSSASGIGILFDFYYPNNSVNLSADKGTFKTWDIEKGSGAVESVGKTYTIENEGYIFWTPDKESIFGDEKIIIHITDSKNVNLGEIVITHDENGVFSAVLN